MAVYTEVPDDELTRFIASYGLGRVLSCKGIAEGVENTNYVVNTERGPFILTLYEKRVDSRDLPFFLGLMDHLAAAGLNCPLPVRNDQGEMLGELAGRPAALVTFLDGIWPRRPETHHCSGVGAALAELHLLGRDFAIPRANALGPKGWPPLFAKFATAADKIAPDLVTTISAEIADLAKIWPANLPQGVIHADLFPDNVFFLGQELSGLIDFYFACTDTLAYDVAICLNAWCFEPDLAFNVTKSQALLAAYQTVRPLSRDEAAALPTFARGSALRFLLTRAHDWLNTPAGALVKPHDPIPYLRRLRFHQGVKAASAYCPSFAS